MRYPADWTPEMVAAARAHDAFMEKAMSIYVFFGQAAADRWIAQQREDEDGPETADSA